MHLNNVNIQGQEHGLWSQQSADMAVSHDALVQRIRAISNDTVGQNDTGIASGTFLETGGEQLLQRELESRQQEEGVEVEELPYRIEELRHHREGLLRESEELRRQMEEEFRRRQGNGAV